MKQEVKWWRLYAIIPLSLGLLWLDSRLSLQPQGHELLETGIVLASFGLMALWVRANQRAVAQDSCRDIVYIAPADRSGDHVLDWQERNVMPQANIDKRESAKVGRFN